MNKVFDRNEFEKDQAQAKEKWGQTPAFLEYESKTKDYSKAKWNDLSNGMDRIMEEFALCMKKGEKVDSAETQNLVKCLQSFITENYYLCTNDILAGLGQMYVGDDRFKSNIDQHADGTAAFICDAIDQYCGR